LRDIPDSVSLLQTTKVFRHGKTSKEKMGMGDDRNGWKLKTQFGRPLRVLRPPAFEDSPSLRQPPPLDFAKIAPELLIKTS